MEVVLLHSVNKDVLTLLSDNEHTKSILENIMKLHNNQYPEGYHKRFMQAVDKLPIDEPSKSRFHKYIIEVIGNKDCTVID